MTTDHAPGSVIGGAYRLVRILGSGGMGVVWEAQQVDSGERAAVKLLKQGAAASPAARWRMLREGRACRALRHPHVVSVQAVIELSDGSPALVMDLLRGETLAALLLRRHDLSLAETVAIMLPVISGVGAAHALGIMHRDLKPENIFLHDAEGGNTVVKVVDFGLALMGLDASGSTRSWSTETGALLGTPCYMAPEQVFGEEDLDLRADVWAIGLILYQCLSGILPTHADRVGQVLKNILARPIWPLSDAAPDLPFDVTALVNRMLLRSRGDRPTDLREVAAVLVRHHEGPLPPEVPEPSPRCAARAGTAPIVAPVTRHGDAAADSAQRHRAALSTSADTPPQVTKPTPTPPESGPAPSPSPERPSPGPRRRSPFGRGWALAVGLAFVVGVLLLRRRNAPSAPSLAPPAPALPGCTDNRACSAASGGRPSICRKSDGVCVELESEDCRILSEPGDVGNDATIWIGAMFPLSGQDAAIDGNASRDAVDLARRDFAETVSGLPPQRPGGRRRPLAVVACDDAGDPARVAGHLVDDLRVPAIIGFHRSKEVADLAASHFIPRGVLALASNTAPMLRTIPQGIGQPRLVWRTEISSEMLNTPVAALLASVVEPELRATPGLLAPDEPIRVAHVRIDNASGLTSAADLVATLRFNGKSVAENGSSYRQMVFADAPDEAATRREIERLVAEIVRYRPHVVIGGAWHLAPDVERAWPAAERFRPRYLQFDLLSREARELVRRHPEARTRMFHVDPIVSSVALAKFVLRHNEIFPNKITAFDATVGPYDAFYVAAYAAVALGSEPITGPGLARAILRLLPPGEPVDVGPAGIYGALAALDSGKNIDLAGAVTSLDFDPETGDAPADFSVLCLSPAQHDGVPAPAEAGLVFRARSQKLEGRLRCP